jgi:phage terminase large subunit
MPFQQLLGDCNPWSPSHWLKQRANRGQLRMLESRHEDNPSITPQDMAVLDALTGVRYQRLRLGLWVAAEGQVYSDWDPRVHLVDRFAIPPDWPRYWVVDFGYTNPFCLQCWAQDPDGRLYRYREIYKTQTLVEDHARQILGLVSSERDGVRTWREPLPQAIICDHDAEGRATFERYTGFTTVPARKAVTDGIQAVQARLRKAGDGRPRLFLLRDSLVERDRQRDEARRPCCGEEEIEGYVWDTSSNRKQGEEPVKADDHSMDCTRYLVSYLDLAGGGAVGYVPNPWED